MKIRNILLAAVSAALIISVCSCNYSGTKENFTGNAYNNYASVYDTIPAPASVEYVSGDISMAAKRTVMEVLIISPAKLDEKTIDSALNFYSLSDNTVNKYFYPVRSSTPLAKELIDVSSDVHEDGINDYSGAWYNDTSCVKTFVTFMVDTSKVITEEIAFVADAAKLKDKTGRLVLDGNYNHKCGEESDSYIQYITVEKTSDDNSPAVLSYTYSEDFCRSLDDFGGLAPTSELEKNGTVPTGKILYTIDVSGLGLAKIEGINITTVYPKEFEEELKKMYVFRYLPKGASSWKEETLNWKYFEADKEYKATSTTVLAYGAQYCLSVKENNSLTWDAAKPFFGHTVVFSWAKNRKEYTDYGYFNYLAAEPSFIVDAPDNTINDQGYTPKYCSYDTFRSAQRYILDYRTRDDYSIEIFIRDDYVDKDIRFDSYDGFVITDNKLNKLKTKPPVVFEKDDKGIISIILELENPNLKLNFNYSGNKLFVGGNTSIPNRAHDLQRKFGTPELEQTDCLTGYVKLSVY